MAVRLHNSKILTNIFRQLNHQFKQKFSVQTSFRTVENGAEFGLLFDIDGVIVRGHDILPCAKDTFNLLVDSSGKFRVPTIFVTNAGNSIRQTKADQLSKWLGVQITADQVVMSHSPLSMYHQLKNKHCLFAGQGQTVEIARHLGFTRITTIDMLNEMFPMLDVVDMSRRRKIASNQKLMLTPPENFEKIDAIVLLGEPVGWETALQLIIDVLVTDGRLIANIPEAPYPHLPVLACSMDLVWIAEAPLPRFGHGCFLHCLETVYQKLTGHKLEYAALVGKPSTVTYLHAHNVLNKEARKLGLPEPRRIYCIGDNPDVDIYGANLYNRHLQQGLASVTGRIHSVQQKAIIGCFANQTDCVESSPAECVSVLVCTGVFTNGHPTRMLNHNHRDFVADPHLKTPVITADNVLKAVQEIFCREQHS